MEVGTEPGPVSSCSGLAETQQARQSCLARCPELSPTPLGGHSTQGPGSLSGSANPPKVLNCLRTQRLFLVQPSPGREQERKCDTKSPTERRGSLQRHLGFSQGPGRSFLGDRKTEPHL